jgi:hypothetical protein
MHDLVLFSEHGARDECMGFKRHHSEGEAGSIDRETNARKNEHK